MGNQLVNLILKQIQFQTKVNLPIETTDEDEKYELGEIYLFKSIEEIVELRKEFPSIMNKYAKNQKKPDMEKILNEFSDVLFFLMNFAILWRITPEMMLEKMKEVQTNNFKKLEEK